MKTRIDFINHVIQKMDYKTYLEVGVYLGEVFNTIQIEKTGVDIDCNLPDVLKLTSDEFFEGNTNLYDIIFIDGDHNYEQVKKDVDNALECLTPNGMVLMHDTCPTKASHVGVKTHEGMEWCGQAFELAVKCYNAPWFDVITWNKDFGVSVITKGDKSGEFMYRPNFDELISSNYATVNAQNLGVINEWLDNYKVFGVEPSKQKEVETEVFIREGVVAPTIEEVFKQELSLKERYKLSFPDVRIGRKSDKTLIKELKEAGFEI